MKRFNRLITILLVIVLTISGVQIKNTSEVKAGEVTKDMVVEWQSDAIESPAPGKLVAAGYMDIKWKSADDFGKVKNYKIYIDNQLKYTAGASTLTYEYYTTTVKSYKLYIKVEFTNGTYMTTNTSTFYVTKKGLAVNRTMGRKLDPAAMNMGWYYTWGQTPFSFSTYGDIEFVPMIWGNGNTGNIPYVASLGHKYLLAYNEPDINHSGGSGIDVNTVISNWNQFLGYDYHLGSPAPSQSPSWESGTWFRTFMDNVDHDSMDFIALHCYYGTYGGVAGANTFLEEVVDKTYQMYKKPIWVTEFAVSGWGYSNASARESVKIFMETVIEGLNSRSYVERYSWFSFDTTDGNNGASALWTNSTGELTELGKTWVANGNPTGYGTDTSVTSSETAASTVKLISKPGKAKIKSLTSPKKKTIKLVIKKQNGVKGYQVKYAKKRNFKGAKTQIYTKRKITIKKLKSKTKYYVKVRAYKKNGSEKLYGVWSKVKKVKVK